MSVQIIPLEDLKSRLRATGTGFDAALRSFISLASQGIETFCRREFDKRERIEFFNTRQTYSVTYALGGYSEDGLQTDVGEFEVSLKAKPVDPNAVLEAHYDRLRRWTSDSLVPAGNVFTIHEEGRCFIRHPMDFGSSVLRIRYTAGYPTVTQSGETYLDPAQTPDDLRQACLVQAMFLWTKLSPENVGVDVDRGESKARPEKFSAAYIVPEAQALLAPHRRLLVGSG